MARIYPSLSDLSLERSQEEPIRSGSYYHTANSLPEVPSTYSSAFFTADAGGQSTPIPRIEEEARRGLREATGMRVHEDLRPHAANSVRALNQDLERDMNGFLNAGTQIMNPGRAFFMGAYKQGSFSPYNMEQAFNGAPINKVYFLNDGKTREQKKHLCFEGGCQDFKADTEARREHRILAESKKAEQWKVVMNEMEKKDKRKIKKEIKNGMRSKKRVTKKLKLKLVTQGKLS